MANPLGARRFDGSERKLDKGRAGDLVAGSKPGRATHPTGERAPTDVVTPHEELQVDV